MNHTNCLHEATPKARAKCRREAANNENTSTTDTLEFALFGNDETVRIISRDATSYDYEMVELEYGNGARTYAFAHEVVLIETPTDVKLGLGGRGFYFC